MIGEWSYFATRLNGDGTETVLARDVPLSEVKLTHTLSGHSSLEANITPEIARLIDTDGLPIFDPWSTAIYAEAGGSIRAGCILEDMVPGATSLKLTGIGFTGYAINMPYDAETARFNVDPLNMVRDIWKYIQKFNRGNLGLVLDGTTSPVRIGKLGVKAVYQVFLDGAWQDRTKVMSARVIPPVSLPITDQVTDTDTVIYVTKLAQLVAAQTPFNVQVGSETITVNGLATGGAKPALLGLTRGVNGTKAAIHAKGDTVKYAGTPTRTIAAVEPAPYTLAWYQTDDLAKEIDDLAKATPFDYFEEHAWAGDPDNDPTITHRLRLGYPRLGRRRLDLAFVIGDNVMVQPDVAYDGDSYASEVMTLGAGEGSKMVRGSYAKTTSRLRRVAVVKDQGIRTVDAANKRSQRELAFRLGLGDVAQISVRDHPNAPVGSWAMGDEVLLQGDAGWAGDLNLWVRVVGQTLTPDDMSVATLNVIRTDKVE